MGLLTVAKTWTVPVEGVDHKIEYTGAALIVDGTKYKLKSMNWFIRLFDYEINLDGVSCRLVAIGDNADLAVNGRYLGSGEAYEPVSNIPVAVSIFAGVSVVLGFLMNKWVGAAVGCALGAMYFNIYLKKRSLSSVIVAFAVACVLQIVLGFALGMLILSLIS